MPTTAAKPLAANIRPGRQALPPGPRGLPLAGILPALRRDELGLLVGAARDYGDLVHLPVPVGRMYLLNHPDHIRHVLQENHANYRKTRINDRMKPVLGEGLVTSNGALWAHQRRLMQPAFLRDRLVPLGPMITATAAEMLDRWSRHGAADGPLDVAREMSVLPVAIIARAMFGTELGARANAVADALDVTQAYIQHSLWTLTTLQTRLPTPANRRFRRAMADLHGIVMEIIEGRRSGGTAADDLLSMLLRAQNPDSGQGMTDEQLRDEVMTMLLAGHETTANALTWIWHLLDRHPEVLARLTAEVDGVLAGRVPTVEDLPALPYTKMVIQEALRVYPPVWRMGRTPLADDAIGGYRMPAGAVLIICQYILHRDPRYWDNPQAFNPERFSAERSANRPRFAYLPFGAGPRACIGSALAMLEMQLVVPMVVQRFRLRLAPGHRVEMAPLITLRPRGGMPMLPEPRTHHGPTLG